MKTAEKWTSEWCADRDATINDYFEAIQLDARADLEKELATEKEQHNRTVNLAIDRSEELEQVKRERDAVKAELEWQNNRNSGHPTKGGFEFYINEEWTGLATAALDTDPNWHAALRKIRIDPDDERVRVRRVIEDDAILKGLDHWKTLAGKLKLRLQHTEGCDHWYSVKESCTCGLTETLKEMEEMK